MVRILPSVMRGNLCKSCRERRRICNGAEGGDCPGKNLASSHPTEVTDFNPRGDSFILPPMNHTALALCAPAVTEPSEPIEADHGDRIPPPSRPHHPQPWSSSAHFSLNRAIEARTVTCLELEKAMERLGDDRRRYGQAPRNSLMKATTGGGLGLWICSMTILVLGVAAKHPVPEVITHIAAGTSIAASAMFPPLRNGGELVQPSCLVPAVYGIWGAAFMTLLVCELLRRPTGLQRRLLVGTVLFSSLNLLGTLSQSTPSTLEGIMSWGPMALTASLCVIPVFMDMVSPRSAAEMVANMAGVHIPVQEPRRVHQYQR